MTPRVRREGAVVRKALTDATSAASGARLERRSRLLVARGVRTPEARYDASAREITFPWIAGTSGRDVLRRQGRDRPATESFLAACLLPLARLHDVDPRGLDLAPLDPWRRIDPRLLALDADKARAEAAAIRAAALRACRSAKERFIETSARLAPAERVLAHGDYHVGQLLFASPTDEPWLLDLDDLALAPRESDLGNFAAHLATVEEGAVDAFDAFCTLASLICRLYGSLAGHEVDRDAVDAHGAIALMRRSLKLRERGARADLVVDVLSAADRLAQGSGIGWGGDEPAAPACAGHQNGDRIASSAALITCDKNSAET